MRILIIDSSIQIIERLEEIIAETGIITLDRAVSCEEAKKLLTENRYEGVLLDIHFPGSESLKLLKEIKDRGGKIYVIAMFNHIDNYILEKCKSAGVDLFFDKYYDFEKIAGVINAIGHEKENSL